MKLLPLAIASGAALLTTGVMMLLDKRKDTAKSNSSNKSNDNLELDLEKMTETLSEEFGFIPYHFHQVGANIIDDLKEHWNAEATITADWNNSDVTELPASELQKGEIAAYTFTVGQYSVRTARRVYRTIRDNDIYKQVPAEQSDVDDVSRDAQENVGILAGNATYDDDLTLYIEVTACYGAPANNDMVVVCRAQQPKSLRWTNNICTLLSV